MRPLTRWFSPGTLIVYTPLWCACFLVGHAIDHDLTPRHAWMSLGEGLFVGVGMALFFPHRRSLDAGFKRLFTRR